MHMGEYSPMLTSPSRIIAKYESNQLVLEEIQLKMVHGYVNMSNIPHKSYQAWLAQNNDFFYNLCPAAMQHESGGDLESRHRVE